MYQHCMLCFWNMGFIYFWFFALAVFFICLALFEIWYHKYEGFTDWWYREISRKPRVGDWYYKRKLIQKQSHDNTPD